MTRAHNSTLATSGRVALIVAVLAIGGCRPSAGSSPPRSSGPTTTQIGNSYLQNDRIVSLARTMPIPVYVPTHIRGKPAVEMAMRVWLNQAEHPHTYACVIQFGRSGPNAITISESSAFVPTSSELDSRVFAVDPKGGIHGVLYVGSRYRGQAQAPPEDIYYVSVREPKVQVTIEGNIGTQPAELESSARALHVVSARR